MADSKDLSNKELQEVVGGETDLSLIIFPKESWIQRRISGSRSDEETFYTMDVVGDQYELTSFFKAVRTEPFTSYNKRYRGFRKQREFEDYIVVDKSDWIKDNPSFRKL